MATITTKQIEEVTGSRHYYIKSVIKKAGIAFTTEHFKAKNNAYYEALRVDLEWAIKRFKLVQKFDYKHVQLYPIRKPRTQLQFRAEKENAIKALSEASNAKFELATINPTTKKLSSFETWLCHEHNTFLLFVVDAWLNPNSNMIHLLNDHAKGFIEAGLQPLVINLDTDDLAKNVAKAEAYCASRA